MVRGDGLINPDGVRDYELLVPAEVERHVVESHGASRERLLAEAETWRASFPPSTDARTA
jgi:hypothetical protein